MEGWYAPAVEPEHGKLYEFEDFIGARFVATFDRFEIDEELAELVLYFTDRAPFATNVPIRFRDALVAA